ncbi:hypothetical protein FCH28_09365 [Streptomyces piniterrae]|uniref:SMI1/KNR4 family protein n=2 Tax=Streptomyces piniterrae TaxID=2571125 RepID=A0A4U0NP21_9ACTN|nr:hypothetical protein FCH28_09365 [Streptomyces piniterrae]
MTEMDDTVPEASAAWLEARFGKGSLWRPAAADLPAELTHQGTRDFLTTTGFPAVNIDIINFDSTDLLSEDGDALYLFDADELYGYRYPDDESPPENFCLSFGTRGDQKLMLDCESGGIDHYDPNGWDHGAGYKGQAASSLPDLAVLLGLIAERCDELASSEHEVRATAVAKLREDMRDHDPAIDDSPFWDGV